MTSHGIAAVVVHYQTPRSLNKCLQALRAQASGIAEIVVVDNSAHLSGRAPVITEDRTRHLCPESNIGFGAACNLGARNTTGALLLFLNADLELEPEACAEMATEFAADPTVAVVGPRIYGSDGQIELSARRFPTLRTGVLGRSSLATRVLASTERLPRGLSPSIGVGGAVDWVSGACMLVRRSAFDQVQGFDEGYWMYWEDADLCRRLGYAGWRTALAPGAKAHHDTGSSGRSERTIAAFHTSAARYYRRHVARTRVDGAVAGAALAIRSQFVRARHLRRSQGSVT